MFTNRHGASNAASRICFYCTTIVFSIIFTEFTFDQEFYFCSVFNMSNWEPYSDEHRIFLQGIMARGILNAEEVHTLLKMACRRCNVEIPVDQKGKMEKLKRFIQTINKELESVGLQMHRPWRKV